MELKSQIKRLCSLTDRKEAFFNLVNLYVQADDPTREYFRMHWPFDVDWQVPIIRDLLKRSRNSRPCHEEIRSALVLQSFEAYRRDTRDIVVATVAILHAAKMCGIRPVAIGEEVARISVPEFAEVIRGLYRMPFDGDTLKKYGWKVATTRSGLEYQPDLSAWGL